VKLVLRKFGFVLAGLGLVMILVTATPLVPWWAHRLAGSFDDPKGDTLIVLGGTALDNNTVGLSSYWRAVYAARAYRAHEFRQVIVCGGTDRSGHNVAIPLAEFLIFQGVPRDRVRLEARSTSTRENALFAHDLVREGAGRVVLLTSDYHMYRAQRVFRKAGIEVTPHASPDIVKRGSEWPGRWPGFLDLLGETAKIGYYRLRGWI
jgi:uncharacterized SAM-binding protein YcdF (DUF218 family)